MGAAAGFGLAVWAARAISSFQLPLPIPILFDFNPDLRVLAFTAALSILTGILFGLAPALRATRPDLVPALKSETSTFGRKHRFSMRDTLVVVQVALSLVLLAGSGLFLRSLQNASSIDIGLRPENVLLMAVDPKLHRYSPEKTRQFLSQLRDRVAVLPEARAVTYVDSLPLSLGGTSFDFKSGSTSINADVYNVGARFFETMSLPLLRGRDFNSQTDTRAAAVINQTFARRLFGDEDPIGRQMTADKKEFTVIGLSANSKSRTLGEDPAACAYLFLEPKPDEVMSIFGISLAVKTTGNPRGLERAVRAEISTLDPTLAIFNIETMEEHVNKALLIPRVCATLLSVFGLVGLTLAAIGLYGVMSYSVRRRTREFGIRMALGARQADILSTVLRHGLLVTSIGLAIGLALALSSSRFAASFLYGISATDPHLYRGPGGPARCHAAGHPAAGAARGADRPHHRIALRIKWRQAPRYLFSTLWKSPRFRPNLLIRRAAGTRLAGRFHPQPNPFIPNLCFSQFAPRSWTRHIKVHPPMSSSEVAFDKGLPSNVYAERLVLGSILLNDTAFVNVASALEARRLLPRKASQDLPAHVEINDRGDRIDRVTVANELMRHGELEAVRRPHLPRPPRRRPPRDLQPRKLCPDRQGQGPPPPVDLRGPGIVQRCMIEEDTPDRILAGPRTLSSSWARTAPRNPSSAPSRSSTTSKEASMPSSIRPLRIKGISTGF